MAAARLMSMSDDEYEQFLESASRSCYERGLPMTGEAMQAEVEQDCSLCPPGDNGYHQYKVEPGCFVNDVPSCRWCAMAEEAYQSWIGED